VATLSTRFAIFRMFDFIVNTVFKQVVSIEEAP